MAIAKAKYLKCAYEFYFMSLFMMTNSKEHSFSCEAIAFYSSPIANFLKSDRRTYRQKQLNHPDARSYSVVVYFFPTAENVCRRVNQRRKCALSARQFCIVEFPIIRSLSARPFFAAQRVQSQFNRSTSRSREKR